MTTPSEYPDPLVPPEVDLRGFETMPLAVQMVRDSRFVSEVKPEAFRAGFLLWCASWHQVPAGSVPDNDIELAKLAGYGFAVSAWKKLRREALTKFIRCSDGRLYHEEVSARALTAWQSRLEHFYDRARERLRKANKDLKPISFEQWNERRLATGTPLEKASASPDGDAPSAGSGNTPPQNSGGATGGFPPEIDTKGEGEGTERERNGEGTERKEKPDPLADPPADRGSDPPPFAPTKAGEIGMAFRRAGIPPTDCNFSDPVFAELLRQGATVEEFEGLAREAKTAGIEHPWKWVLSVLPKRRAKAAGLRLPKAPSAADPDKASRVQRQLRGAAPAAPETFDA